MSKYSLHYSVVGRQADWNDKTTTGRVLKWELNTITGTKKERDTIAAQWAKKFADAGVAVQKVMVRPSKSTLTRSWFDATGQRQTMSVTTESYDKLTVYIDPIN